jgi:hypothetical protein
MRTILLVLLTTVLMSCSVDDHKACEIDNGRRAFLNQPIQDCPHQSPSPSPGPSTTPDEAKSQNVAEVTYQNCLNRSKRSKDSCTAEKCADEYLNAVATWDRPDDSNYVYCKARQRDRLQKVKCVRRALKTQDEAERIVAVKECGA